jgi:hypothetical protein
MNYKIINFYSPVLTGLVFLIFSCKKDNSMKTSEYKCSCKSTSERLSQDYIAFVPNLLTPNGDGKNDKLIITVDSLARDGSILSVNYRKPIKLKISTKEGTLIYSTDDYNGFWAPDVPAPEGLAYKLEVSIPNIMNYVGYLSIAKSDSKKYDDVQCCKVSDPGDAVFLDILSR